MTYADYCTQNTPLYANFGTQNWYADYTYNVRVYACTQIIYIRVFTLILYQYLPKASESYRRPLKDTKS